MRWDYYKIFKKIREDKHLSHLLTSKISGAKKLVIHKNAYIFYCILSINKKQGGISYENRTFHRKN